MKTTGVLPEVFAASISWFSRSEIDTIGELLSVAVISIDPTFGRQGSPSEWSRPELNPAPRHERSASVGAGVEIRASKRGSAPTGCGCTRRAPWGVVKILIPQGEGVGVPLSVREQTTRLTDAFALKLSELCGICDEHVHRLAEDVLYQPLQRPVQ